ncbi:MAG: hypothetical protein Q4P66_03535 [Actinomycetaceae bacterium]|nr:hypothetical protein [Actinomycetaceae bacterium]
MSPDVARAHELLEQLEEAVARCQQLATQENDMQADATDNCGEEPYGGSPFNQQQLHVALHDATQQCAQLVDALQDVLHTDGQMTLL